MVGRARRAGARTPTWPVTTARGDRDLRDGMLLPVGRHPVHTLSPGDRRLACVARWLDMGASDGPDLPRGADAEPWLGSSRRAVQAGTTRRVFRRPLPAGRRLLQRAERRGMRITAGQRERDRRLRPDLRPPDVRDGGPSARALARRGPALCGDTRFSLSTSRRCSTSAPAAGPGRRCMAPRPQQNTIAGPRCSSCSNRRA